MAHKKLPSSRLTRSLLRLLTTANIICGSHQYRQDVVEPTAAVLLFDGYVLLQTLRRLALAGTGLAQAQCGTIRLKLLKIGAQVRVTVHKIWISLAGGYPHAASFVRVLAALETGNAVP